MSLANRCDRCGKFERNADGPALERVTPQDWIRLQWQTFAMNTKMAPYPKAGTGADLSMVGMVDLCRDCRADFSKFMNHYIDMARG